MKAKFILLAFLASLSVQQESPYALIPNQIESETAVRPIQVEKE